MLKAIQPGGVCRLNSYMICLGVGDLWFPFLCVLVVVVVARFWWFVGLFVPFVWLVFLVKIILSYLDESQL